MSEDIFIKCKGLLDPSGNINYPENPSPGDYWIMEKDGAIEGRTIKEGMYLTYQTTGWEILHWGNTEITLEQKEYFNKLNKMNEEELFNESQLIGNRIISLVAGSIQNDVRRLLQEGYTTKDQIQETINTLPSQVQDEVFKLGLMVERICNHLQGVIK